LRFQFHPLAFVQLNVNADMRLRLDVDCETITVFRLSEIWAALDGRIG
jgi:hypothetical protein